MNDNGFLISPSHKPERFGQVDILLIRTTCSPHDYDIAMPIVGGYLWFEKQSSDIYRLKGFFETLPPKDERMIVVFSEIGLFLANNTKKADFSFQRQLLDEAKTEPVSASC